MMSSFDVSPVSNTITPRLVCGTWLVTGARLLSVQVNQTPGLHAGLGFYPKFYGRCDLYDFSVVVLFWMLSLQIELSGHFSADFLFSSGIKSDNFLTLLFRHVLSRVSNVNWIFKLIELHMCLDGHQLELGCISCSWQPNMTHNVVNKQ